MSAIDSIGKPSKDPKAWARRICARVAAGQRYDSELSLAFALEALGLHRADWDARGLELLTQRDTT